MNKYIFKCSQTHHQQAALAQTKQTTPTLAEQQAIVIGVDTHKVFHVAVVLSDNGGRLMECNITANQQGYPLAGAKKVIMSLR